ncbi:MAG: SDR family oxidoreductase [Pseudomonadota bacterium]
MGKLKRVKRVLVTGATGLLGVALQRFAPQDIQGHGIIYPERSLPLALPFEILAADVSDRGQLEFAFERTRPDVVIHAAAVGSVDYAEKNREETRRVNVGGTANVVALCEIFNSRLVYISSNAVFDGRMPFYSETAPVNPINHYGVLKVEAEKVVREGNIPWAIVRPILMYGWPYPGERDNPVVWWVRSLENGQKIRVVDNVFNKPLATWSCAAAIWAVVQQDRSGVYHVAGRDHMSLYQFALLTADVFNLDAGLIQPVPDSFFPEIAPRPRDTSFDTTKMETELGVRTIGVEEGLIRMKAERPGR